MHFLWKSAIIFPTIEEYDLYVKLSREMQLVLKDATELAYSMGDIPKPDLVKLMKLFIISGLSIHKKKWLDGITREWLPYKARKNDVLKFIHSKAAVVKE